MLRDRYIFLSILAVILLTLALLGLGVCRLKHCGYGLSYQVSSSMPKGWYGRVPIHQLQRGDWVFFHAPAAAESYLLAHHWLPTSGVLLKSVQALPGDWACIRHHQLWINQRLAAPLLTEDSHHQAIAAQPFCRRLAEDEYIVLGMSDVRSYDSRYFGPIHRSQLLGRAISLLIFT